MGSPKPKTTNTALVEVGRTIRWIATCLTIYGGIERVTWLIGRVLERPPWLQLVVVVLSAIASGSGIAGLKLVRRQKRTRKARAAQPPPVLLPPPKQGDKP